jgi:3-methyladenine DNA glycosylase Tag
MIAADFINRAAGLKGGMDELEELLQTPTPRQALPDVPDDRWLSRAARGIMAAGFVWKVVDNMWAKHEEIFEGFQLEPVAFMSDTDIDRIADLDGIIGHRGKLAAIRDNGRMMLDVTADHGSFGAFVAEWPEDDIVGLWTWLKKNGKRLGGMTGPYFLRAMGVDTPLMTQDVVKALVIGGVIDKKPTSQKALREVQAAFSAWKSETGRSYNELSKILACSLG